MSAAHTPTTVLPWHVRETPESSYQDAVIEPLPGNGGRVASCDFVGDAAHIVRCVNAHDDLVAALTELIEVNEFQNGCDPEITGVHRSVWVMARAALAKVAK